MKRKASVLCSLLAALMLFSACSGAGDTASSSVASESSTAASSDSGSNEAASEGESSGTADGEKTTISLIHRYVDANIGINSEDTAILQMLQKFKEEHPDVEVIEEQLQPNEYQSKAQVLAAANDLPDVFFIQGAWVENFVNNGLMSPLNEDLDKRPEFRDGFRAGSFDRATVDGNIYGIPMAAGPCHVVFYNSKMYADVGYDSFPTTWDDLMDCWGKLKETGVTPVSMGNKDGSMAEYAWLSTLTDRIVGSEWTESICDASGATFEDPGFIQALTLMDEVAKAGYLNPDLNSVDGNIIQSYYFDGKTATIVDGIWNVVNICSSAPEDILEVTKAALFPAIDGGKGNPANSAGGAGSYYSVNANVEAGTKRDLIMDMLEQMTGADCAAVMAGIGGFPAYDPGDFDRSNLDPLAIQAYDLCNVAEASRIFDLWFDTSVVDVMKSSLQEMLAGAKTPEEVASDLQTEYERYLQNKELNS